MDSDDEFMSAVSSDEDIALDDSDNEDLSGADG
jgi:ariadne-1